MINLEARKVLILYKTHKKLHFILTNAKKQVVFDEFSSFESKMVLRHMDAAALYDQQLNKYAPLLAILYDENVIDLYRGEGVGRTKLTFNIPQWVYRSPDNRELEGFLVLLPYSDFLVVAKEGETKIWFKNYINTGLNSNDRSLETAFRSILNIFLSPEHKILTVFDRDLTALIQFFVTEIGCGDNFLIKSCSGLYLNKNIECVENGVWNILDKKCFCLGGYYIDINTRSCLKCKCSGPGQFCRNSATDCYSDSYYEMNLDRNSDVADKGCWLGYGEDDYL